MKDGERKDPVPWQRHVLDGLDALRTSWLDVEDPPLAVGRLSSGEYAALAIACGFERNLRNPVVGFLLLDGWLQGWVMRHRGMAHLVGTRVGVEEFE